MNNILIYVGPSLHTGRGFYATMPIGYDEELRFKINCGTNEELFLAIAALRDDSDINQWFTDNKFAGSQRFTICKQDSWKEHFNYVTGNCGSYKDWHKALESFIKKDTLFIDKDNIIILIPK